MLVTCTLIRSNQTVAGLKRIYGSGSGVSGSGFKSDRCGIETLMQSNTHTCIRTRFKSDRCGIETRLRDNEIPGGLRFKSDRCGIETIYRRYMAQDKSEFKSDRCGIETYHHKDEHPIGFGFKSDRCGIETLYHCPLIYHVLLRSNQTVAGLKLINPRSYIAGQACSNQTVAGLKR